MSLEHLVLTKTDDFTIRHAGNVHSGKVRSVYWLTPEDSQRLIRERQYPVHPSTILGVAITSDRISAFDRNWQGEHGLSGIPGKAAVLNTIAAHWLTRLKEEGIGNHHLLEMPHPYVWIIQKAKPILIEAIARQYITGSLWRAYTAGEREFAGITLPDGLQKDQQLSEILLTPTTKGTIVGLPGIAESEDAKITRPILYQHHRALQFCGAEDIETYESMVRAGFQLISKELLEKGYVLVDDKSELGYVYTSDGRLEMIFIDEKTTPDSARMWDAAAYAKGTIIEDSKEGFRQFLLTNLDRDVLLNDQRMNERGMLARQYRVPVSEMMKVSAIYRAVAQRITGKESPLLDQPRAEIVDVLNGYGLIE